MCHLINKKHTALISMLSIEIRGLDYHFLVIHVSLDALIKLKVTTIFYFFQCVTADRLQGLDFSVSTEAGPVNIKDIYSRQSTVSSQTGPITISNMHTTCTISTGGDVNTSEYFCFLLGFYCMVCFVLFPSKNLLAGIHKCAYPDNSPPYRFWSWWVVLLVGDGPGGELS